MKTFVCVLIPLMASCVQPEIKSLDIAEIASMKSGEMVVEFDAYTMPNTPSGYLLVNDPSIDLERPDAPLLGVVDSEFIDLNMNKSYCENIRVKWVARVIKEEHLFVPYIDKLLSAQPESPLCQIKIP